MSTSFSLGLYLPVNDADMLTLGMDTADVITLGRDRGAIIRTRYPNCDGICSAGRQKGRRNEELEPLTTEVDAFVRGTGARCNCPRKVKLGRWIGSADPDASKTSHEPITTDTALDDPPSNVGNHRLILDGDSERLVQ